MRKFSRDKILAGRCGTSIYDILVAKIKTKALDIFAPIQVL